jgi:hypothetical protein
MLCYLLNVSIKCETELHENNFSTKIGSVVSRLRDFIHFLLIAHFNEVNARQVVHRSDSLFNFIQLMELNLHCILKLNKRSSAMSVFSRGND